MAVKYNGIQLVMTGSPVAFTSDPTLWGFHVIVTASAGPATIRGPNGVDMASIATGQPSRIGGMKPISGEPIQLNQYSASAAAGNVHIAYAARG